jgi:hypothetical protein
MAKKIGEKKKENAKTLLENQIKKLIKGMNEEGLVFLIEQAQVIRHNMEIDKLNENIDEINKTKLQNKGKTKKGVETADVEIIPDDDKKNFVFQIANERKFITRDEMRMIVKICQSDEPLGNIAKRLYQWLYNERKDVLIDCHVRTKDSAIIDSLVKIIKKKYKTK